MTDSNGEEDARKPFHKTPIFIGAAALLALSSSSIGVLNWLEGNQEEYDANVAADALQLKLEQDNQIKIDTAFEFSQCWAYSNCDPDKWPSALPADDEQFERLDQMEAALSRIHRFLKKHCQGHRDAEERWSDCTDL